MKSEDLIHLKFEYEEALQSKRNILYSEKNLMIIAKKMNNYISLREEELKTKVNLHRKIRGIIASIRKLQRVVPNFKVPKIIGKEGHRIKKEEIVKIRPKAVKSRNNIESQLQEIQEKLNTLQK